MSLLQQISTKVNEMVTWMNALFAQNRIARAVFLLMLNNSQMNEILALFNTHFTWQLIWFTWMRDKTADFKTRQNSRFSKRDKTADFQNGTKQPIFKTGQNSRFSKRDKMSAVTTNMHGTCFIWRGSYLLYGSVASLPSPSSNIEAWLYGTSLRFALLLHLGH